MEVRDLVVEIRGQRLVDGLSFTIAPGTCTGLVGESGCGKTMSALAVMNLLPDGATTTGSVRLGELELLGLPDPAMRRLRGSRVAMIFQEPLSALNPVLTVGHQIAEMYILHDGLRRSDARVRAIEALEQVRMPDPQARARAYPHQLSGGMRQRVMIAMALACDPELLIADEPTTALDVTVQAQVLDLIRGISATRNMAILFISHNLAVVSELADQVVVMYAGQAMENAPALQVLTEPAHPYTHGLIQTLPRLGQRRAKLPTVEGQGPDPRERAVGCPFTPRCDRALDKCATQRPAMGEVRSGHQCACFHPIGRGAAAGVAP